MAALPYMQLYVADYLADTAHLSTMQHGGYLLLIMNYWQRGKPLKDDNERLANVARMSNEDWAKNRDLIAEFFSVRGGEWVHHRIERDLVAVAAKSSKAAASGRASAQRTLNERSTNAQRTFNHTDTDTEKSKATSSASEDDRALKPESQHEERQRRLTEVVADAVETYNAAPFTKRNGGSCPNVTLVNDVRRAEVRRCLKVASDICTRTYGSPTIVREFWVDLWATVDADDHKSGRIGGGRDHAGWKPDFEFLTRPNVMTKLFDSAVSASAAPAMNGAAPHA